MADPLTIIAVVSSVASTATAYVGAQRQAKAAEYAATAAEQQGKYNAQIAVNNMVAEQNDIRFAQRAEELKKNQLLAKSEIERTALKSEIAAKLAKSKIKAPTFGGTFSSVFAAEENEGYDKLAAFDFGVSQDTAAFSSSIMDSDRQLGYAYQRGMADRDLTLRTAANNAVQFRNQASSYKTQGVATALGGIASTASFAVENDFAGAVKRTFN